MEKSNSSGRMIKLTSNKGTVLILVAILLPILILFVGMVIDIGKAMAFKAELNKACMVAAEEATKCIDIETAQSFGANRLKDNYSDVICEYFSRNYKPKDYTNVNYLDFNVIESLENPKYIEVFCQAEVKCFFLKIIGINEILIHSKACGRLRRIK